MPFGNPSKPVNAFHRERPINTLMPIDPEEQIRWLTRKEAKNYACKKLFGPTRVYNRGDFRKSSDKYYHLEKDWGSNIFVPESCLLPANDDNREKSRGSGLLELNLQDVHDPQRR